MVDEQADLAWRLSDELHGLMVRHALQTLAVDGDDAVSSVHLTAPLRRPACDDVLDEHAQVQLACKPRQAR